MQKHCFLPVSIALGSLLLLGLGGCNRDGDEGVAEGHEMLEGSRGDESVREQCVERGVEVQAVDVDNDGNPDIRHAIADGVRRCTEIDMNFDGRTDVTRFYGPDGQTAIREEHDFDFDGRLDQIVYYENGILVRKELDTNFNQRIDTWMWCDEQGLNVVRAERDRSNDGDVDTWEEYEDGLLTKAAYDNNNDGEPEMWELFREGRMVEIRNDTDRDGRPDRREEIPMAEAGPPDERLTCNILPEQSEEEPEAAEDSSEESGDGDDIDAEEGVSPEDAPTDAEGEPIDEAAGDDEGADE